MCVSLGKSPISCSHSPASFFTNTDDVEQPGISYPQCITLKVERSLPSTLITFAVFETRYVALIDLHSRQCRSAHSSQFVQKETGGGGGREGGEREGREGAERGRVRRERGEREGETDRNRDSNRERPHTHARAHK